VEGPENFSSNVKAVCAFRKLIDSLHQINLEILPKRAYTIYGYWARLHFDCPLDPTGGPLRRLPDRVLPCIDPPIGKRLRAHM